MYQAGIGMGARVLNAVLGVWLFVSVFLWPHSAAQRNNAWVVGIVAVTAALAGLRGVGWGRRVNALLGGWLIVSALFLPRASMWTFWNHVAVGFGLVLFGLAPSLGSIRRRTPIWPGGEASR
jgi:hypothetical protein